MFEEFGIQELPGSLSYLPVGRVHQLIHILTIFVCQRNITATEINKLNHENKALLSD